MNGHQPKKPIETKPPIIKPLVKELDIAAVTEQLNGLLDRYNALYGVYSKFEYARIVNERAERIKGVLSNLEKAIEALCLRLSTYELIVNTE